jgi:hypothetical protein
MNTGLQDAHNLAWKLAFVFTHNANDYLLDTYHNERFNNAKKLVHTTDRAFGFISLIKYFRLYIKPYILQFILQPLYNGDFSRNIFIPGDRFPYVIYDSCHYHFVIFENEKSDKIIFFIEFI